jgi:outer membrane beta-barrel protein
MKLVYGIACTVMVALTFFPVANAAEDNMYTFKWLDEDKEVHVLQNRIYVKKNHAHVGVGAGMTLSGPFVDAWGFQGRLGYFFTETLGIEAVYAKNSPKHNTTYEAVDSQGVVPFAREVTGYMGGMFLWSPFYAKMNLFNQILYYDWIFGLGMANLNEENNRLDLETVLKANRTGEKTKETHSGVMWDASFRFYLSQTFSMRFGVNGIHYSAKKALGNELGGSVSYSNYDLLIGLYLNL